MKRKKLYNTIASFAKHAVIIAIISMIGSRAFSQTGVSINTTGATPNAAAMLDVQSTTRGLLIPSMTTAQRNLITLTAPAQGLMVFDNVANAFYYNTSGTNATTWVPFSNAAGVVTSFSAGLLSPLFTTSVANPNTTPALSFALSNSSAYTLFGNNTAAPAAPTYFAPILASALFQNQGATTSLLHGNAAGSPAWGQIVNADITNGTIDLTTKVNGTLPIGNGGTNSVTALNNNRVMISSGGKIVENTALTSGRVVFPDASGLPTGSTNLFWDNTNGRLGIGTSSPSTTLHVNSAGTAIQGQAPNGTGYLGYNSAISLGTFGSVSGANVYSADPVANYPSLLATSNGSANYAAAIGISSVWIGGYFGVDNSSSINNPKALYGQLNVTSSTLGGIQAAVEGYNNRAATANNPGYSVGVLGVALSQNQTSNAIMGLTYCDVSASSSGTSVGNGGYLTSGGYFETNTYAGSNLDYAYVAGYNGSGRKIIGTGSVAEIVPTPTHGRITLVCPESPEYWYVDYGTVQLVNGKAHVNLDPILADIIMVDASNPLKVFPQVNIPTCNGVAVINKTASGFDIVEVNSGSSSGEIDYQIVAKPKTNYGEGRFAQAPGPAGLSPSNAPQSAMAKNQPEPSKIWHWPSDNVVYHYALTKLEAQSVKKTSPK